MNRYDNRLHILTKEYDELISRENEKILPAMVFLNDTNIPF